MKLSGRVAVIVVVAIAGAAAASWWAHRPRPAATAGETVSLSDGELTFGAPAGWHQQDCGGVGVGCVELFPPGSDPAARPDATDYIGVSVAANDPKAPEGDLSLLLLLPGSGATVFTVDGVRFARDHLEARTEPFASPPQPSR